MDEWKEFTGKTVEEALAEAISSLNSSKDDVEYEIIEKETKGILGIFGKPAKIKARIKEISVEEAAKRFLTKVFGAMNISADIVVSNADEEETLNINIIGDDMGVLIGKRGQTLDSLQYLTSLVVNKNKEGYLKVKLDTENYRERRKETLENLAKNISFKVKKTHKPVSLEPMNPYERRIIHSALQNDKFVETHSEGEEPYRKVVVTLKKNYREFSNNRYEGRRYNGNSRYNDNKGGKYNGNGGRYNNGSKYNKYNKYNNENGREYAKHDGDSKDYSTDYKKDYAAYLEQKAAAKAAESANNNSEK